MIFATHIRKRRLISASVGLCLAAHAVSAQRKTTMTLPTPGVREIGIGTIDISSETERHVVIERGRPEVYQGHPTTVLMPDGKTMFCVWTRNHGGPCGPLKRSDDAGLTWSDLLPVPENWTTVRNCPAIYRLADPQGVARLFVFAGQGPGGSMHQSYSEDDGRTWTPMAPNGLACVMPFCTVEPVDGGRRLLAMSNIRRPGETEEKLSNVTSQSLSSDGGLTWSEWEVVADTPGCKICEPELVRSPDGKQLLCLMRENNRALNAWMIISDDEGKTWSPLRQLPASLSGDRHKACYAPDGRLVVCFRDTAAKSPTRNHFVAWVGTYDDIIAGREGRFRIKLLHSYAGGDCGYPGLECLPDGTLVATTYIKYAPGADKHSVVSVRFTLIELDRKIKEGMFVGMQGGPTAPLPLPSLASEATVDVSSEFRKEPFPAAGAVDGDMSVGGRWVSDSGGNHWLTLTWPEKHEINRVRVWTGHPQKPGLQVADYTIQYWDGAGWQVAAAVRNNDKDGVHECNDLAFEPVTTDKLKMEVTRTPTDHARVIEIAVHAANAAPEATPPLIDEEPCMFVDDDMIAKRTSVTRAVHACDKLPESVLVTEMPWEGDATDSRVYIYGTVLLDTDSGQFRMWYNRGNNLLYATSFDGAHWDRPKLGLAEWKGRRDSNILPISIHSPSIVLDGQAVNDAERYKALGAGRGGYVAAHSPDELHWEMYPINPVLKSSDTCTLAQDPRTGECLAFHKRSHEHRGHVRRLVYLATSKDMQTWSEARLAMAPDAIDDAQTIAEGGQWSQFYNMSVFPYGGQFLGLVTHFRFAKRLTDTTPGQSPDDGPIDVQLVHSRDGRNWRRLENRLPVIPNGPHPYDAGCILGTANQPVIVGDEMWIYYTAINTTHGGALPQKVITIARASWRRDGFVSLDAGDQAGVVETIAFQPSGDRLVVNADASRGEARIEILDGTGEVIPGYGTEVCVPIRSDSVRHAVRWKNHDRLPDGRPLALRFHLRDTSLYSYAVNGQRRQE